jgi:hypothetical protein
MTTKNFFILMLSGTVLLLYGCSDYLGADKYFKDRTTIQTVFTSKTRSEEWLSYAYSFLQDACADVCSKGDDPHCFADDMYYGDRDSKYDPTNSGALNYNIFKLGEYDEDNYNNVMWGRCYRGIYQASVFINNIDINPEMTDKEKLDYKGQARFVRAYYYWLLLRKYGPVPIMPDAGVDYTKSYEDIATPRSPYDSVADYISTEMVQAAKEIQYLKRTDNSNIARPAKGAALATRAYALIFAASPLANGNNDNFAKAFVDDKGNRLLSPDYDEKKWAKAAAACKDVMQLGVYDLYHASFSTSDNGPQDRPTIIPPYNAKFSNQDWPNGWRNIDPYKSYRNLFDGDVSAVGNPELIFSRVNNYTNANESIDAFPVHQMPRDYGGWNTHGMTQKMCDAYYMNDGTDCPGKDKEIGRGNGSERLTGFTTQADVDSGRYKPLAANVSLQYANREPRFYASVAYSGSIWGYLNDPEPTHHNRQTFYYRGGGDGYMNSPFHLRTGIGVMKFINPQFIPTNNNIIKIPEPAIRYADILLLYAEALNELTSSYSISSWDGSSTYTISRDISEIKKGTNPVRIRAGLPDYSDATYANRDLLRKALKRERMIELMGEGKRYYDLRRWKDAPVEEALPIYGCNIQMDAAHRDQFYIPVIETDLPTTFSNKMYFWPIKHSELQRNKCLTQEPGWTSY